MSFPGFPKATQDYITHLSETLDVWESLLLFEEIQNYRSLIADLQSNFRIAMHTQDVKLLMHISKQASLTHKDILLIVDQRQPNNFKMLR